MNKNPSSPDHQPGNRALVIQTGFAGDVVLASILTAALARQGWSADILTSPRGEAPARLLKGVREVLVWDNRSWRSSRELAHRLRERNYRRVLTPHPSWRNAWLSLQSGSPERIGPALVGPGLAYTLRVPPMGARESLNGWMRRFGEAIGLSPELKPGLALPEMALNQAESRWRSLGEDRLRAVCCPGSAQATKRWPPALFARLLKSMDNQRKLAVLIAGGDADRPAAAGIQSRAETGVILDACGESWETMAAQIATADVVITGDSAPLHLAAAFEVPVLAIFGPTPVNGVWTPEGSHAAVLGLSCQPCSRSGGPACPLGHHRCMMELTPELVLSGAPEFLPRPRRPLP